MNNSSTVFFTLCSLVILTSWNRTFLQFSDLLTLTLDQVRWHTTVYHSSTSIYTPNFVEIGKTFRGQTDGQAT